MKKKGKTLLTGLGLILTLALCLTACGTSKTQEITSKSHSVIKSIGTASNNLNAYKAKVQNKTGKKITSVEIKNSIDNEYGDDLLDSGDTFKNNEVRYMYYDATDAVNTAQEDGKEESSIKYYVKVTLDNDSTYVISKFPFNKIKGTAKIYFNSDKEVCYLIYTNKSGKKINTKKKKRRAARLHLPAAHRPTMILRRAARRRTAVDVTVSAAVQATAIQVGQAIIQADKAVEVVIKVLADIKLIKLNNHNQLLINQLPTHQLLTQQITVQQHILLQIQTLTIQIVRSIHNSSKNICKE